MSINTVSDDGDTSLERAAEQALDLRATVADLADPALRQLVDVVLFQIGIRLAKKAHGPQV